MDKVKKINSLPKPKFMLSKKLKKDRQNNGEFQDLLDGYLAEIPEELDAYPLNLPIYGGFWDDGHRDIRVISQRS